MRKVILILAATALAVLLAGGVGLVVAEEPAQAAFPGENGRIAYFNCDGGDCEIYSIPAGEGYLPTQLTHSWGQNDRDPAYSPDGTNIAFTRWDGQSSNGPNNDIWVLPSNRAAPDQRVTNTGTDETHPAYSPDGTTIVYTGHPGDPNDPGQDEEIYAIPASGGTPVQLTDNSTKDVAPVYSPDGKTIAYMAHDGQDYEIATMPATGGTPTKLTDNATGDSYPDFSPDGATIAYGSYDGQDVEIYSVPATGGTPTKLTDNTVSDSGPAYSPDGKQICYMSYDGQDNEITTLPAGGGRPTRVTDNATPDYFPDWGVAAEAPRDNTPPDTDLVSGPQGPTNDATPTFTFVGSDDTTASAALLYSHKVDGEEWSPYSLATSATLGGASGLSDGDHTFYVRAMDERGIPDFSPAERSFTVDTVAPAAPVISSPANNSNDADGSIAFSGTAETYTAGGGAYATVEIYEGATLKGTVTANYEGQWSKTLSGVANGTHTYTAKAIDQAGNTSAASSAVTVTVGTTSTTPSNPSVSSTSPLGGATGVLPGANVTATFSEAMMASTINRTNVKLVKKGTTTVIGATVTYDSAAKRATLNPNANLVRGAYYTATVTTAAKDLAGYGLDQDSNLTGLQPKTWTFRVRT